MSERAATAARDAAVTPDDVERAARNIAGLVRDTPTLPAGALSRSFGAPVVLKAESLQLTGSFKIRGATNAILGLSEEQRRAGVVAASAGNHAQAVALAAARIGAHATLCMPLGAPLAKLEAVRQYGGEVRLVPGSYDEAQDAAATSRARRGRRSSTRSTTRSWSPGRAPWGSRSRVTCRTPGSLSCRSEAAG